MAVMPGSDRHGVDLRVLEDFASVGGGVAELVALGNRLSVHPPGGADRHQAQILERVKVGKKHRFCIVAGADHAEPDLSQRRLAIKANGARLLSGVVPSALGYSNTMPTAPLSSPFAI